LPGTQKVPFKGRIQKRKRRELQIIAFGLQRAAGPYGRANCRHRIEPADGFLRPSWRTVVSADAREEPESNRIGAVEGYSGDAFARHIPRTSDGISALPILIMRLVAALACMGPSTRR
jgi:hypothetical protein